MDSYVLIRGILVGKCKYHKRKNGSFIFFTIKQWINLYNCVAFDELAKTIFVTDIKSLLIIEGSLSRHSKTKEVIINAKKISILTHQNEIDVEEIKTGRLENKLANDLKEETN